ncbi:MAG TPA: hypothetical protein VET82_02795 [Candidatus Eisenbacteria bacterium]|nr:hypothetical protein [Candidatus Eisenbacteria bacterium]
MGEPLAVHQILALFSRNSDAEAHLPFADAEEYGALVTYLVYYPTKSR